MKKRKRHFRHCFAAKGFFSNSRKITPNERNALNGTDKSPCQKLTAKIKAFRSAFEIKDLAAKDWSLHQTVHGAYATRAEQRSPITYERDKQKVFVQTRESD